MEQISDVDVEMRAESSDRERGREKNMTIWSAASLGNVRIVRRILLKREETVDARDYFASTALMYAASCGQMNLLSVLIDAGADVQATNVGDFSPLAYACLYARVEVVFELLARLDVDINSWFPPLLAACTGVFIVDRFLIGLDDVWKRKYVIVDALLRHGADVNIQDEHGYRAIDLARYFSQQDIIQLLERHGAISASEATAVSEEEEGEKENEACIVQETEGEFDEYRVPTEEQHVAIFQSTKHDDEVGDLEDVACSSSSSSSSAAAVTTFSAFDATAFTEEAREPVEEEEVEEEEAVAAMTAAPCEVSASGMDKEELEAMAKEDVAYEFGETDASSNNKSNNIAKLLLLKKQLVLAKTVIDHREKQDESDVVSSEEEIDDDEDSTCELEEHEKEFEAHIFFMACDNGDMRQVETYLWLGFDIETRDEYGYTPLFHAAQLGNMQLARLLIACKADVNALCYGFGTPLLVSALSGCSEMVRLLLSQGADPNIGSPAIVTACIDMPDKERLCIEPLGFWDRKFEIVQELLRAGANVETKDAQGKTAHRVASLFTKQPRIVALLESAMKEAVSTTSDESGEGGGAKKQQQQPQQQNQKRQMKEEEMQAFFGACKVGDLKSVTTCASLGYDLEVLNREGQTALSCALANEHSTIAALLKSAMATSALQKAKVGGGSTKAAGGTALRVKKRAMSVNEVKNFIEACKSNDEKRVHVTIAVGFDIVGIRHENTFPLFHAAARNHMQITLALLDKGGVDIDEVNTQNVSALARCCGFARLEMTKLLLSRGANPNKGNTSLPLHMACVGVQEERQHLVDMSEYWKIKEQIVVELLKYGANCRARDALSGLTVLEAALLTGQPRMYALIESAMKSEAPSSSSSSSSSASSSFPSSSSSASSSSSSSARLMSSLTTSAGGEDDEVLLKKH